MHGSLPVVTPYVSILLPFRDHEHVVGQVVRDIAKLFREQEQAFQILAVDEGSGDNSHSMLALLRHEIPELRIVVGRGYVSGCATADANVVVLMNVEAASQGICPSVLAGVKRVSLGEVDMHLVDEQLLVSGTKVIADLIATSSSWRPLNERDLFTRGKTRGYSTRSYCPSAKSSGTFTRLLDALSTRSKRSRVATPSRFS